MHRLISSAAFALLVGITSTALAQQQERALERRSTRELEPATASSPPSQTYRATQISNDPRTGAVIISTPGQLKIVPVQENATYFGVSGVPVEGALREQLGLKKGMGVLVERVEKGSPAEAAGLKQYDVLEKLDDQLLVNGQQLAVLIRSKSSGEQIKLAIIRQGQKQELTATLVEKLLPALSESNLWGLPDNGSSPFGTLTLTSSPKLTTVNELLKKSQQQAKATIYDEPYRLEYSEQDQKSHLQVWNTRTNNLVYDGPADTEGQRNILPEQVRRTIGKFKPLESTTKPAQ